MGREIVKAVGGRGAAFGQHGSIVRPWQLDSHRLLEHFVAHFEAGEEPGVARHRPAQQAKFEHVLNVRRREDRHASMHQRSEEHTSELQSLMRNSYAVFCLKKKITTYLS